MEDMVIYSKELERNVFIKAKYSQKPTDLYLYFFDGQNIFDEEQSAYGDSWHVDEILEDIKLDAHIIGIVSQLGMKRIYDLLPWPIEHRVQRDWFQEDPNATPRGKITGEFIINTLLSAVEKAPAKKRLIAGSSMGGFMSLYMGSTYPEQFKHVIAMSTAAFITPEELSACCASYKKEQEQKVYLDVGVKEGKDQAEKDEYLLSNRMLKGILETKTDLKHMEDEDGIHNETSWRKRLPDALKWHFL